MLSEEVLSLKDLLLPQASFRMRRKCQASGAGHCPSLCDSFQSACQVLILVTGRLVRRVESTLDRDIFEEKCHDTSPIRTAMLLQNNALCVVVGRVKITHLYDMHLSFL